MEMHTIVTLLTVMVILLSLVIVTLLAIAIAVLVKIRKIAKSVEQVTVHVAAATEWLTPTKVLGQIVKLFRK